MTRPMTDGEQIAFWKKTLASEQRKHRETRRKLYSTSAAVRGMREVVEMVAALDACEAHVEDALERIIPKALAALSGIEPGEDEQARPLGSAPISTVSKDTTK